MYYDDGSHVLLGWDDGDRVPGRNHSEPVTENGTDHPFFISAASEKSSGKRTYYYKYYFKCAGAWLGGDTGRALSYYSDRLKNPLKNQGFPPNLVLMKKCSFASKHF